MSAPKSSSNPIFEGHNTLIAYLLQILEHQYKNRAPALNSNVINWVMKQAECLGDSNSINNSVSLLESSKCVVCISNISLIKLNCNHHLCTSCIGHLLQSEATANVNYPAVFKCPKCPYMHTSREMHFVAPEFWGQFLANYKKNRIKQNIDQKCDSCQIQMKSIYFPEQPPCAHHTYCKECLTTMYLEGKYHCMYCGRKETFKRDPRKDKGICSGCTKKVFYLEDSLTRICDEHFHCLECLRVLVQEKRCKCCGFLLEDSTIERVRGKITKFCSICSQEVDYCLTVHKRCCGDVICVFCQADANKNNISCVKCSALLDPSALETILEVKSIAEDLI